MRGYLTGLVVVSTTILTQPTRAAGQATPIVNVEGRVGKALVTNTTADTVVARVALWESIEGRPDGGVELTQLAKGRVWPDSVLLAPEEFQTVRILLDEGAYSKPTRLRLETLLSPVVGRERHDSIPAGTISTRLLLEFRMLSRVEVQP